MGLIGRGRGRRGVVRCMNGCGRGQGAERGGIRLNRGWDWIKWAGHAEEGRGLRGLCHIKGIK